MKRRLVSFSALFLLIIIASGLVGYSLGQTPTTTFTVSSGVYPGAPSYTIFTNGTHYFSKSDYGQSSTPSTNASYVIQAAINALPSARLVPYEIDIIGDIHITNQITVSNFTIINIKGSIFLNSSSNTNVFNLQNAYDVTIIGGSINGNKAGQTTGFDSCINIQNSNLIKIEDVFINNAYMAGIYASNTNDTQITGCTFKDNGQNLVENATGIYWYGGYHNSIVGNHFDNNKFAQIACMDWASQINDFTISSNEMVNGYFGIIYSGNFGTISANTLYARAPCDAGIYLDGQGNQADLNTITGNTISGHMDGIGIEDGYCNTVSGNTIYATWGGHGVYVFGNTYSTNNTISGNNLYNIAKNGIYFINASFNIATGNRLSKVNQDTLEGVFSGINETNSCASNLIIGNYLDSTGTITLQGSGSRAVGNFNGSTFVTDTYMMAGGLFKMNSGTANITDAATIQHGLGYTPTTVVVLSRETGIVATDSAARDGTIFYVSLRFLNGSIPSGSHVVDWLAVYKP